jgi:predicted DNA-binding protein
MEAHMELTKKTTILFPPDLHERLSRLAEQQGTSLGDLVRKACEIQYGLVSAETRLEAVRQLAALSLPVGDPGTMKRESVPRAEDLLP